MPTPRRSSISSFSRSTGRRERAGAFDTAYNNFTTALQALSTSPSSYSSQTAVLSAAQQLTQNLNSMTGGIQALRSQAEQGIANGVQQANQAMQTIAQINQQLSSTAPQDATTATLEDQRDQAVTQLSQLMNINVSQEQQRSNLGIHQLGSATGRDASLPAQVRRPRLAFGDFALERRPGARTAPEPSRWSRPTARPRT